MERYDVAVVGAGPDGLVAAIVLARAKARVIVLERQQRPGGRAETYEFFPGFKASPYADELAWLPARLFRSLDLARHGVLLAPAAGSACISDAGSSVVFADDGQNWRSLPSASRDGYLALKHELERLRSQIEARTRVPIGPPPRRSVFRRLRKTATPWPGDHWSAVALCTLLAPRIPDAALATHVVADAIAGRAASPFLAGSALHLLAPGTGRSGLARGGMGMLAAGLSSLAAAAGAVLRCGADVETLLAKDRGNGVVLAGGEEIAARAVLSTLDVKKTFLGLGSSREAEDDALARVSRYRIAGQAARVLIALDAIPELPAPLNDLRSGPIHAVRSQAEMSASYSAWHTGRIPTAPQITFRLPSIADPSLAPPGKAVLTATLSCIPYRPAEGGWTQVRRESLAALTIARADEIIPGIADCVLSSRVIVPPDVERVLGLTQGDLDGGEFSADQALGFRPFASGADDFSARWRDARTPIQGLYLAGPSAAESPILLGVAGERAAQAVLADLRAGILR